MHRETIRFPDEQAMARVLKQSRDTATEVVLRLAWDLGLYRDEIHQVCWNDISFDKKALILPDRQIPMEEDTYQCLLDRCEKYGGESEYVVISDVRHQRMRPESISRIARTALDTEPSLANIRLIDLRYGFILRQIKEHGWPYASRVSGIQASTMQVVFLPAVKLAGYEAEINTASPVVAPSNREEIQEIIQKNSGSAVGVALQLSWELGMESQESVGLTWDQIDFDKNLICLSDRNISIGADLKQSLLTLYRSRTPDADPHVLLTPRSMQPYDRFGISRAIRTALVRGGADITLKDLLYQRIQENEDAVILRCIEERGSITWREAAALLHMEKSPINERLRRLIKKKKLVRIGTKYYLYGTVVSPEDQYDVIFNYLKVTGTAFRKDLADLLKIEARPCGQILSNLVKEGKLVKTGQHYSLPPESASSG